MPNQLAANSIRTYRLAPEGFSTARNRSLGQRIGLFGGTVVFLLVLQYKQFGDSWQTGSIVSLLLSLLVLLFVLSAIAFGAKKGLKRNQESWDSYELVIGEDFLIRRMKDFPELEIQRHEVTAIRESSTGLRVETKLKGRAIGIASALVGYEDAKERLGRWGVPLQELRQGWITPARWMWALPLIVIFLFGCFYLAANSWVVVCTGVPLLVGLSWSLWFIRKSLHVSAHTKRVSLITVLPLLAIAGKLILSIISWR